jgi:hypothetical protein
MQLQIRVGMMMAVAALAAPASATIMINQPLRPAAACFSTAPGCDASASPTADAATDNPVPAPVLAAVIGFLALGVAFLRRPGSGQQVSC